MPFSQLWAHQLEKEMKCFQRRDRKKNYRVKFVVVPTQLTVVLFRVPAAGDLAPQCEEKNTQTEQTKEHSPAHTAPKTGTDKDTIPD